MLRLLGFLGQGAASGGTPSAPALTWTSGTGVNKPSFDIAFTDAHVADDLQFLFDVHSVNLSSIPATVETLDAGEMQASGITGLTLTQQDGSGFSSGTYDAVCRLVRAGVPGAWSNIETKTIA